MSCKKSRKSTSVSRKRSTESPQNSSKRPRLSKPAADSPPELPTSVKPFSPDDIRVAANQLASLSRKPPRHTTCRRNTSRGRRRPTQQYTARQFIQPPYVPALGPSSVVNHAFAPLQYIHAPGAQSGQFYVAPAMSGGRYPQMISPRGTVQQYIMIVPTNQGFLPQSMSNVGAAAQTIQMQHIHDPMADLSPLQSDIDHSARSESFASSPPVSPFSPDESSVGDTHSNSTVGDTHSTLSVGDTHSTSSVCDTYSNSSVGDTHSTSSVVDTHSNSTVELQSGDHQSNKPSDVASSSAIDTHVLMDDIADSGPLICSAPESICSSPKMDRVHRSMSGTSSQIGTCESHSYDNRAQSKSTQSDMQSYSSNSLSQSDRSHANIRQSLTKSDLNVNTRCTQPRSCQLDITQSSSSLQTNSIDDFQPSQNQPDVQSISSTPVNSQSSLQQSSVQSNVNVTDSQNGVTQPISNPLKSTSTDNILCTTMPVQTHSLSDRSDSISSQYSQSITEKPTSVGAQFSIGSQAYRQSLNHRSQPNRGLEHLIRSQTEMTFGLNPSPGIFILPRPHSERSITPEIHSQARIPPDSNPQAVLMSFGQPPTNLTQFSCLPYNMTAPQSIAYTFSQPSRPTSPRDTLFMQPDLSDDIFERNLAMNGAAYQAVVKSELPQRPNSSHGCSCHNCKRRQNPGHLRFCEALVVGSSQQRKGRRCRKKFCSACIRKFFPGDLTVKREAWVCPACRHECNCAACKRKSSKPSTTTPPSRHKPASHGTLGPASPTDRPPALESVSTSPQSKIESSDVNSSTVPTKSTKSKSVPLHGWHNSRMSFQTWRDYIPVPRSLLNHARRRTSTPQSQLHSTQESGNSAFREVAKRKAECQDVPIIDLT
eukprot:872740_1